MSLRSCRVLGSLPLLLSPSCPGCSPLFGAACACADERRARVGDVWVNLSARSHREIREPTKTCSLSRDLLSLRAAAVLRFPPVNETVARARIYTRVRRFSFFCLHSFTVWHIGLVVNCLRVKGWVKSWFTFSVHFFTHRSEETSGQSGVNWAFFTSSSPFFAAHWLGACA